MTIEIEMRNEIERLEKETADIDAELHKLQTKIINLINIKKKIEHNLRILKMNFNETLEEKEFQTDLAQLLKAL